MCILLQPLQWDFLYFLAQMLVVHQFSDNLVEFEFHICPLLPTYYTVMYIYIPYQGQLEVQRNLRQPIQYRMLLTIFAMENIF